MKGTPRCFKMSKQKSSWTSQSILGTDLLYITICFKGNWIKNIFNTISIKSMIFSLLIPFIFFLHSKVPWLIYNVKTSQHWSKTLLYLMCKRILVACILGILCIFFYGEKCACLMISTQQYNLFVFLWEIFNHWLVKEYFRRSELLCPISRYVWAKYIS